MLKKAFSFVLVHPLHEAWQRVPARRVTFLNILDEVPSASWPALTLLLSERHRRFSIAC